MHKLQPAILALITATASATAQCNTLETTFGNAVTGTVRVLTPWATMAGGPQRLVAGGTFRTNPAYPASFPCDSVGYWDGAAWRAMGWGTDGDVDALTTWAPSLGQPPHVIAAGTFAHVGADSTGEVAALNIARYDGVAWRPLAAGLDGRVFALTTWDPDGPGPQAPLLIAAGEFRHSGTTQVDYIAAWNGTTWRGLGWGFNQRVLTLTTWDPDASGPSPAVLLAGGDFTETGSDSTGAIAARNAAAWNGTSWSPMSVGPTDAGTVTQLDTFDFDASGPAAPVPIALIGGPIKRWNGSSWISFGSMPLMGHGGSYTAFAVVGGTGSPSRLWSAADTWYWWWSYDGPFCVEGCSHYETGPSIVWVEDGLGQLTETIELQATRLQGWDPDGDGPEHPQVVVVGSFPGSLRSYSYEAPPVFVQQPSSASAPVGGAASFMCEVQSADPVTYTWFQRSRPFGPFLPLSDGIQPSGSTIAGSRTPTLTITNVAYEDAYTPTPLNGAYDATFFCQIVNGCRDFSSAHAYLHIAPCAADFNSDGDSGTDADIEAFFACLAGACCPTCASADFNGDGDSGTDADIESFFRVLAGGNC